MKPIIGEYLKVVIYTIFAILFAMSVYIIMINIHHYKSLKGDIIVSELYNSYSKYKNNVTLIEEKINLFKDNNELYLALSKNLNNMKNGGVFRLIPKTKLNYKDLYELNDYFMEELINNSWVYNLKTYDKDNRYQDTINFLVNNSNYLNNTFISNSLILYDSSLDNKVVDNYHFILNNYYMYSKVVLDMCNELGGVNG